MGISATIAVVAAAAAGIGTAAPAPKAAGDDARVTRAFASLRRNLEPLRTLAAEVTVETVVQQVWTEKVYRQRYRYRFQKPSSIRLDFIQPSGQVVIARGRSVWMNGVRTQGSPGSETEASPLSLMRLSLDPAAVAREYAVTAFDEPRRPALTGLSLAPAPGSPVSAVRVWVDAARGVVEETKVFGAEQALLSTSAVKRFQAFGKSLLPVEIVTFGCDGRCKTTLTYADVVVNGGFPADAFDPVPPKP